jgi:DNA-binding transcriptional LysR family regulator
MNLNHLAIFHAIAEAGSISRGAERLLISQPAVSKQLKELERAMGTPLMNRMPRGVRLNEAGVLLAAYAKRLFAVADEAQRAMDELRGMQRGRLSVGASTTIGVYLLPEVFVKFRQEYPGVQMHLEIADSQSIRERLASGAIDVGLAQAPVEGDEFESSVFMEDELVAIAPFRHPLATRRLVKVQTLCREPFVVREVGSGGQSLIERALADRGLNVRPILSLGNTEAIKRAVVAGLGVAIVSRLTIGLELQAKRLAVVRLSDLSIRRPLYRVELRGSYRSPAVKAFNYMLDEVVRKGQRRSA